MIPITFNNDDTNNVKKGNVRPQDLATVLGVLSGQNAGIVDIFPNACEIYQTSISSIYATVTLHKGYIFIYGRLIYVEEGEQVQINLPTDTSTTVGYLVVRVDLSETGANEVKWVSGSFESFRQNDLLLHEVDGVYELPIYRYTATSNNITFEKVAPIVSKMPDFLKSANYETKSTNTRDTSVATTEFAHNLFDTIGFNFTWFKQGGAQNGNQGVNAAHWYRTMDIFGLRIICGHIYNVNGSNHCFAWWNNGDGYNRTEKVMTISAVSNWGNNLIDVVHLLTGTEVDNFLASRGDGFCVENINGRTITIDYIAIGTKP